jgi:hypothetical protein
MATDKKGTILLYVAHYESIRSLTLKQKGMLLDCIFLFSLGEPCNTEDPVVNMAFSFIKERITANADKYADVVQKRREAGRRHKGNQYTRMEQNGTNGTDNDNVIVNENVNDNEPTTNVAGEEKKEKTSKEVKKTAAHDKRFVKPTPDEVQAYCDDRGNGINGQSFCDFYESKGWKVGSSPMKDWRAAVRTWEQRNGFKPSNATKKGQPKVKLGVGEFIAQDGTRRYGTGTLPPVPMDAPPRPDNDSVWSRESNTWIPSGI